MDINEFRAKVYELLSRRGMREDRGELYFSESAVMDALEFIYNEVRNIPIEHFEAKIIEATARAISKLNYGFSHGLGEENTEGVTDLDCGCDFDDDPF